MKRQKATIENVLEIVEFLKENMLSRDEFEEKLKKKLTEMKNEIMNHMDGFIGLHQKLDNRPTA